MNRPTLHTLHRGREVRHLLIEGDDHSARTLSQVFDGVRTVIDKGTTYEMNEKAQALWQGWMKSERFEYQKDGQPPAAFESLQAVVALLLLMKYKQIFDPKCVNPRTNPLGVVPLAQWKGWIDAKGDGYEYSYGGGPSLFGQPKITLKHGKDLIATLKKGAELSKSLGPSYTFTLG
ncbi:MAG: hypothetical protein WB683_18835 [Candidatus Sulfotelmatobacter sp.]